MVSRRKFLQQISVASAALYASQMPLFAEDDKNLYKKKDISAFSKRLKPIGRILELEGYFVWGTSPIVGPDGKTHLFFSRWNSKRGMGGWINSSEIAHAVGDKPEGPFYNIETLFAPRGEGYFDGTTCHNPHIKFVDGKYCLFYIGNSNKKTDTKRVAMAIADSPYGPWKRPDIPLIEVNNAVDAWDNHCTSNPTFIKHPNGKYYLYYKSWNSSEYYNSDNPTIRGNRKYGLAIADKLEGPYIKYIGNPIVDYSSYGNNRQLEDGYVFMEKGRFYMIARDMGRFDQTVGIIIESKDGIHWNQPEIAYFGVDHYVQEPPAPKNLTKYGRFERPQLLIQHERPTHLFVTSQGGKWMTSSAFVFKID
jgi:hypothetical protein